MRNFGVTVLSLLLTTAVIGNAYYQKKQFYPSVVYITKSNPSMAVMYIQAFSLVFLIGKLMRKVFFGELRAAEFEHLIERSWYAVTETCLAFTVFRDDFSPKFVALFTVLLFLKSFHWLAEDRVDFMERSPVISLLFHLRILTLLTILGMLDLHFVGHAYQSTLSKGASVQLVFGFEYAILLTITINIGIKYILHSIDLHSEIPWENKAIFLLYTELIMGVIKVFLYVMFVFIMVRIYTLPLFAFRPMYYTLRAFKKAFNDVILSRRAIRNMNTLYPDATPEELAAADNVCIICREDMRSASKKLPCNHIFHTACLRSWFQRQQTCPTCRLNILRSPGGAPQEPQVTPQPQGPAAPPPAQPQPPHRHHDNRPPPQPPFNFVFPWPPQQQRPPPGVPDGATDAPGSTPGVSNMPRFPTPEGMPFFCPPFPFIPFNIPPPMPPTTGLSDAELRRMEARTREAVEARISCLQNVQRLLDASVLLMQQYCAAAATSNGFENEYSTSPTDETINAGAPSFQATFGGFNEAAGVTNLNGASQPGPSGTDSARFQTEERSSTFNSASPVVDSDKCSTSSVDNDKQTSDMMQKEVQKTRGSEDSSSSSPSREPVDSAAKTNQTTEQEEARKMRLAKFSQTK